MIFVCVISFALSGCRPDESEREQEHQQFRRDPAEVIALIEERWALVNRDNSDPKNPVLHIIANWSNITDDDFSPFYSLDQSATP